MESISLTTAVALLVSFRPETKCLMADAKKEVFPLCVDDKGYIMVSNWSCGSAKMNHKIQTNSTNLFSEILNSDLQSQKVYPDMYCKCALHAVHVFLHSICMKNLSLLHGS